MYKSQFICNRLTRTETWNEEKKMWSCHQDAELSAYELSVIIRTMMGYPSSCKNYITRVHQVAPKNSGLIISIFNNSNMSNHKADHILQMAYLTLFFSEWFVFGKMSIFLFPFSNSRIINAHIQLHQNTIASRWETKETGLSKYMNVQVKNRRSMEFKFHVWIVTR